MRQWEGNRPPAAEGWGFDGKVAVVEDVPWLLYVRAVPTRPEATGCKLVADGYARNKANYWFMVNDEAKVLVGRDAKLLKAKRPDLYKALRRYLLLDEDN